MGLAMGFKDKDGRGVHGGKTKPVEESELEQLLPRCETPDYEDYPEVLTDPKAERCYNCKLWGAIDAQLAQEYSRGFEAAGKTNWAIQQKLEEKAYQAGYREGMAAHAKAIKALDKLEKGQEE